MAPAHPDLIMPAGSLSVIGLGLKFVGHVNAEARACLEGADRIYTVLPDALTTAWIARLNPAIEPLPFYDGRASEPQTYAEWSRCVGAWCDCIISAAQPNMHVCVALTGHPGICVEPTRVLVRRARASGLAVRLLPGISAEDCLFADLGVDPAEHGCQSFEATDFLVRDRAFATTSALILWQIGIIGSFAQTRAALNPRGLRILAGVLAEAYGPDHEVIVYEAAAHEIVEPVVTRLPLRLLPEAAVTERSTLYVPPNSAARVNDAMLERLGLARDRLRADEFGGDTQQHHET